MKKFLFTFSVLTIHLALFAVDKGEKVLEQPPMPPGVLKVAYPYSNPLRDALRPVPETAIFKMDGFYLWDPSVILVGDTYHLFCSRWPKDTEMKGWMKSHVIRATSKSLFGPYQFQEVVLDPAKHPWATQAIHNPKITQAGNKYLIYHLGIPQWKTGFAFADSIQGPWTPVPNPVISTNNPALLIRPDGSAYAVGKFKPKITRDGKWDANMQAFGAENFNGPYILIKDTLNRLPGNFEMEDPTIWWANNQYNVVCTDWEAKVTGVQKSVVYYTSKDGVNYELYSLIPVWSQTDPVPMQNGKMLKVKGIERPQVFTNKKGAVVALLASIYPDEGGPTYIIIRPVKNFKPKN
ncbi:MAG: glycoside hydrolase family protein [Mariniphaga sp.]